MPFGIDDAAAVIAFVSLGIQAMSGCLKGIQLLTTALHIGKHAEYYRCALLLEEQRLLLWSKRSGLSDQSPDIRLPWAVIKEVLANLSDVLCSVEHLSKRYHLKVEIPDESQAEQAITEYDGLSGDDMSFLTGKDLADERQKILKRARQIKKEVGPTKKFWFAAVDKAKFGELLQEITSHIEKLYSLLNDRIQQELLELTRLQQVQNIVLASKVDEIKSMVEANSLSNLIHLPESTAALLKFIELSGRSGSNRQEVEQLLAQISHTSHNSLEPIFSDRVKKEARTGPLGNRGTLNYDGKRYFVEWKKYDWAEAQDEKKKIQDSIVQLALLLTAPKHPSFHTLSCFGIVCKEADREYQSLYRWPEEGNTDADPKTLHNYLSSSFKPSLTTRFQLARQLANSLFLFHTANWMHKAFSSHNIVFFPASNSSERSLESPYIAGFSYSRPDKESEPSERLQRNPETDIYRHPDCFKEDYKNFHKVYDIYSLGLILLEIAKWRPLREAFVHSARDRNLAITKRDIKSMTKQEIQSLDKELAEACHKDDILHMRRVLSDTSSRDSYMADVAFRAGSAFGSAVHSCISEDFGPFLKDKDDVDLLATFYFKVLKPLNDCQV